MMRQATEFFEWPTADTSIVTKFSAVLFAEHVTEAYARQIAALEAALVEAQRDAERLNSGRIVMYGRDEFGKARPCYPGDLDYRATDLLFKYGLMGSALRKEIDAARASAGAGTGGDE